MLRNSHADGDSHAGLSEPSWPIRALRRRSLFATKRRWRKTVSVLDLEKVAHEGDIVLFAGTGGGDPGPACPSSAADDSDEGDAAAGVGPAPPAPPAASAGSRCDDASVPNDEA